LRSAKSRLPIDLQRRREHGCAAAVAHEGAILRHLFGNARLGEDA
jgi:hypothetical protein